MCSASTGRTALGKVIASSQGDDSDANDDTTAACLKAIEALSDEIGTFLATQEEDWVFAAADEILNYLEQMIANIEVFGTELPGMIDEKRAEFRALMKKASGGGEEAGTAPSRADDNDNDDDDDDTTDDEDIDIGKLARQSGFELRGNDRPLKGSTMKMIAEAAATIRGLKQDLLNEAKVVAANAVFQQHYGRVKAYVRDARAKAKKGDETAIRESWTFLRGGMLRSLDEADALLKVEACNEEVAQMLEDFLRTNKLQRF